MSPGIAVHRFILMHCLAALSYHQPPFDWRLDLDALSCSAFASSAAFRLLFSALSPAQFDHRSASAEKRNGITAAHHGLGGGRHGLGFRSFMVWGRSCCIGGLGEEAGCAEDRVMVARGDCMHSGLDSCRFRYSCRFCCCCSVCRSHFGSSHDFSNPRSRLRGCECQLTLPSVNGQGASVN